MDDYRPEPPFPLYEGAVCIYPCFRVVICGVHGISHGGRGGGGGGGC